MKNTLTLPWDEIECVLLDMDGTLLDLNFDTYFWQEHLPRRYAFTRGLDIATAKRVLEPHFSKVAGTLDWYCLDYWSELLGLDIVDLKKDIVHLIAILEGATDFMDRLRQQGKRTILVTNAHPDSLALKLEHTRLDNHLDRLISVHEVGVPKEEVLCWKKLQALEPFDPARTLLVDDNLVALRSARQFGIRHLLAACKPDSCQPARPTTEFAAFHRFDEIMPTLV